MTSDKNCFFFALPLPFFEIFAPFGSTKKHSSLPLQTDLSTSVAPEPAYWRTEPSQAELFDQRAEPSFGQSHFLCLKSLIYFQNCNETSSRHFLYKSISFFTEAENAFSSGLIFNKSSSNSCRCLAIFKVSILSHKFNSLWIFHKACIRSSGSCIILIKILSKLINTVWLEIQI